MDTSPGQPSTSQVASMVFTESKPASGLIKSGDNVMIKVPSGDIKSVQVHDRPKKINLGKFGSFNMDHLIGHPYGLSYEILKDGALHVRPPDLMEELGGKTVQASVNLKLTRFFLRGHQRHKPAHS